MSLEHRRGARCERRAGAKALASGRRRLARVRLGLAPAAASRDGPRRGLAEAGRRRGVAALQQHELPALRRQLLPEQCLQHRQLRENGWAVHARRALAPPKSSIASLMLARASLLLLPPGPPPLLLLLLLPPTGCTSPTLARLLAALAPAPAPPPSMRRIPAALAQQHAAAGPEPPWDASLQSPHAALGSSQAEHHKVGTLKRS